MGRKDIRSNGRNIPLMHHSARGNVQRNSGNFTRGSQLLTHEMLMSFSGTKLPFLLWLFVFLIAFCLILAVKLAEPAIKLIGMQLSYVLVNWYDIEPNKRYYSTIPRSELPHPAISTFSITHSANPTM